jgi:hypothetical protein
MSACDPTEMVIVSGAETGLTVMSPSAEMMRATGAGQRGCAEAGSPL